jgi:hypothetical protein
VKKICELLGIRIKIFEHITSNRRCVVSWTFFDRRRSCPPRDKVETWCIFPSVAACAACTVHGRRPSGLPIRLLINSRVKPREALSILTENQGFPRMRRMLRSETTNSLFAMTIGWPNVHAREFKLRLGFSSYDEQMTRNWHRQ